MRECIADGRAPLDATDAAGFTALMRCCVSCPSLVGLLIESCADVNRTAARDGSTALLLAAKHRTAHTVHTLLSSGARLTRDAKGLSALHMAVENPDPGVVQLLLRAHVDPSARDHRGRCALTWALLQESEEAAAFLIRWRLNVNARAFQPSVGASGSDHVTGGRSAEADEPAAVDEVFRLPAAHTAFGETVSRALAPVSHAAHEAAQLSALERWLSVDSLSRLFWRYESSMMQQRTSLLHVAAANGMVDTLRQLVDSGARLDVLDSSGRTPLEEAQRREQRGTEQLLLELQHIVELREPRRVT